MSRNQFCVTAGTEVLALIEIRDEAQHLADPGSVVVKVRRGDSTTGDMSGLVTRDSVGKYHLLITTTQGTAGYWTVEVIASGTGPNVVHDAYFVIEPAEIG